MFSGASLYSNPYFPFEEVISLKKAFENKFYIGTALNAKQISGGDEATMETVKKHFNAIVAENIMKSALLQPEEGKFTFELADQFVAFGEENGFQINGHTLIWHSQAPKWFFTDQEGKDVGREVMIERMRNHIQTVVGRYKGRVHTWDVVNETIMDGGSRRPSKFQEIIGDDFVELAFKFAHEADPEAKLIYNDYSMANPLKRAGVVAMVKEMQNKGIPIDGIGMQGHINLNYPSIEEFEKSILAFADLGISVSITELDLSVLPSPKNNQGAEVSTDFEYQEKMNPYTDGLPDSVHQAFDERYIDFFRLFLKHQDKISRVTFWGVKDDNSWKNNWPIKGRTDYPLLFDRNNQPKPVVSTIIEMARYENGF
jgi:endo-1,4-beta-xylanase